MIETNDFTIDTLLAEYLASKNLLEEVVDLITTCRKNNPKRWAKTDEIKALNTAFDWEMPNRGFEFWEEVHSGVGSFIIKKKLESIKTDKDVSGFVELMHPKLIEFLLSQNCLPNYIINCITFIEKYGATHIDPPLTIEQHLKNVRDILNAFRCSETPEGKEFWRDVNEVFINWQG